MKVITHKWEGLSRSSEFNFYPLADVHLGSVACDEKRWKADIQRIADDPVGYWIGLGDYCEFINRSDKRYDQEAIAPWLRHKTDMATEELTRFVEDVKPIAHKCLGLVCGNHETSIVDRYENDVYHRIVMGIKVAGEHGDRPLALGSVGWLQLRFHRDHHWDYINISCAHGHTGGRLAGGKALDLERWLWTHDCDLALMGHSHVVQVIPGSVQQVKQGSVVRQNRIGVICGSYLTKIVDEDTYPDRKGYLPITNAKVVIRLRPGAEEPEDQIRVMV